MSFKHVFSLFLLAIFVAGCSSGKGVSQELITGDQNPASSLVLGIVGIKPDQEDIEYKRRAPLVMPATDDLPTPVSISNADKQWASERDKLRAEFKALEKELEEIKSTSKYQNTGIYSPSQREVYSRFIEVDQQLKRLDLANPIASSSDLPSSKLLEPDLTAENADDLAANAVVKKKKLFPF